MAMDQTIITDRAAAATGPQPAAGGLVGPGGPAGRGVRPPAQTPMYRTAPSDPDDRGSKPRLRMPWLKRADVDEEMWPEEAFGGVTDEQFWQDVASDKPLATTARTAQQDPGSRQRVGDRTPRGPIPADPSRADQGIQSPALGNPVPAERHTDPGRLGAARPHAYPEPLPTAGVTDPASTPVPAPASSPLSTAGAGDQTVIQPAMSARPPLPARTTSPQPAQAQGRSIADDDPLTSAAFSRKANDSVDSRSYQASRRVQQPAREPYDAAISQETQTFSLAEAQEASGGYPGGQAPFGQAPARTSAARPGRRQHLYGGQRQRSVRAYLQLWCPADLRQPAGLFRIG